MMTKVRITSEYRTITHSDARFNPKYIFVDMLLTWCRNVS